MDIFISQKKKFHKSPGSPPGRFVHFHKVSVARLQRGVSQEHTWKIKIIVSVDERDTEDEDDNEDELDHEDHCDNEDVYLKGNQERYYTQKNWPFINTD